MREALFGYIGLRRFINLWQQSQAMIGPYLALTLQTP